MTHSTHDLEVLAAHASGFEPDRGAAEALLATCEECRLVYDEQVGMRFVLSQAGAARLNEAEQATLLAALGTALPIASPVTRLESIRHGPANKPLSPVWGRMLAAAAALAVVVGVGALLPNRGNQTTTTLAATDAAAPEFAAGGANDEQAAETTAAAATIYGLTASDELSGLKAEAQALEEADANQARMADLDDQCPSETEGLTIRAIGESTYQERRVILILAESDGEVSPRAFYADDCSEIPLP